MALRPPLRLALAAAALALSCAAARPPPPLELAWQSPLHRDHPLVGRVWDVRAGRLAAPEELLAAAAGARFLLLGEVHDNADHHLLEARLLRAATAGGRRPALALEMLDRAQQPQVDAALSGPDPTADGLRQAVGWDRSGWPAFALYRPVFEAALQAHLPVVAANLSRADARAVVHEGPPALPPAVRALLDAAGPPGAAEDRERREEMAASHCGQLPEALLGPMVLAQRARDAQLAAALRAGATADGAVLVTGAEHARQDRGVGAFLRAAGERAGVTAVAFREVDPGVARPADLGPLPWDYVVFTPGAEREDPCAGFAPPAP